MILLNVGLPVDFCFCLHVNGTGYPFLSADDEDGVVAIFEVGKVEDVLVGGSAGEIFEEDVTAVLDGDGHRAIVCIYDGDSEFHFAVIGLRDGDLKRACRRGKGYGEKKGKNGHCGDFEFPGVHTNGFMVLSF